MTTGDQFCRLWDYFRSMGPDGGKPAFSAGRYGSYIIFGGLRPDGSRHLIAPQYFGEFGSAVNYGLLTPEFYAHHLDLDLPYNDEPGAPENGFVQDLRTHQVMMYTDGMAQHVKPSIPLSLNSRFQILGGFQDLDQQRPVLVSEYNGFCSDAISAAIDDNRFYAHNLNPCEFPICDNPASEFNGVVKLIGS